MKSSFCVDYQTHKKAKKESYNKGYKDVLQKVDKLLNDEKKIVKRVCLGLVHPSYKNQKEFTKWLQNTVNFHINQIKLKLAIKDEENN